jgi:hypothetical protein
VPGFNESLGVVGLIVGFIYVFNASLSIYWIQRQKRNVEEGIDGAVKNVINIQLLLFICMW